MGVNGWDGAGIDGNAGIEMCGVWCDGRLVGYFPQPAPCSPIDTHSVLWMACLLPVYLLSLVIVGQVQCVWV